MDTKLTDIFNGEGKDIELVTWPGYVKRIAVVQVGSTGMASDNDIHKIYIIFK